MATDTTSEPPATSVPTPVPRTYEDLARELSELEKQFPPPEKGDCYPDARWCEANEAALSKQYLGMHVAIMNGAVVGHGWNEPQLLLDVARKYNVHPQRVLVVYMFSVFE